MRVPNYITVIAPAIAVAIERYSQRTATHHDRTIRGYKLATIAKGTRDKYFDKRTAFKRK
jgi:hypothetical protein